MTTTEKAVGGNASCGDRVVRPTVGRRDGDDGGGGGGSLAQIRGTDVSYACALPSLEVGTWGFHGFRNLYIGFCGLRENFIRVSGRIEDPGQKFKSNARCEKNPLIPSGTMKSVRWRTVF